MSAALLDLPSLRSPFGKSLAIHGALAAGLLACMLWNTLSSRSSILEAPLSLELHSLQPSPKTQVRQAKRSIAPADPAKPSEASLSKIHPLSAPPAEVSEQAMGTARTTYLSELRGFIERNKSYPPQARTLGHEGQAEIRFSILSDGTLASIELTRSSGSSILDQAALSLLQRVQKLSPIPAELRLTRLDLVLPIQYSLN
jgi:protein TonB